MAWWKWIGISIAGTMLVVLGAGTFLMWQMSGANGDPAFFEDSIVAFEEADAADPPPKNAILFVGSSSIRLWSSLAEDMAPLPVINRGFGGAHFEHLLHNIDRIVLPYAPRSIVVYAGDNDLAGSTGKDATRVVREYREFIARVHAALPETRIFFLSIKPSHLRWERWPEMRAANARIQALSGENERLEYVDLASPLLGDDGQPRDDVFQFDGLHLNDTGYAAWAAVLRPVLVAGWE